MSKRSESGRPGSLHGRTVLITGGGKGIGRETARLFAQAGCNLVISGRDREALEATAHKLRTTSLPADGQTEQTGQTGKTWQTGQFGQFEGPAVLPIQADVTKTEECRHLVEAAVERFGRLDVLINNAGMSMRGNFADTSLELFDKVIDINFTGAVHMTSYALPFLRAAGGSVVFVSSLSGLKGLPGIAPYGAAKMALTGFAESLYSELYREIHVGVVYVSFTENDPGKQMYAADGSSIPLKRDRNSSTQLDVARSIRRMVKRRQRRVVMTPLGKTAGLLFALFPRATEFLISRLAAGSKMYGRKE
ncbi:MAG: SDR family NAD(P)-dependent oxidoreductase [Spirochaetota bacterium]